MVIQGGKPPGQNPALPLQMYLRTEIDLESGQVRIEESNRAKER